MTGERSVGASTGGYQRCVRSYGGDANVRMYTLGQLGSVKLNFLVNTDCTHNLLFKAMFDHLPETTKGRPEPQSTTAMLADSSGFPVYGTIVLPGRIGNLSFSLEFLVSRSADEGISYVICGWTEM